MLKISDRYKSSFELESMIQKGRNEGKKCLAIVPVGCVEQHGPVLPLETDSIIAELFAYNMNELLRDEFVSYTFPTIHYTTTGQNMNFIGTVSVHSIPFREYIRNIYKSLLKYFDALVIVNGHGSIQGSINEVSFDLLYEQYENNTLVKKPVILCNAFDFDHIIQKEFNQKFGRHADWKEFVILYNVLGTEFFTIDKINKLKELQKDVKDSYTGIIGIPMEFRSNCGTIGDVFPIDDSDLDRLSNRIVELINEEMKNHISKTLNHFWTNYDK